MAGLYPDAPANKMAVDDDGTVEFYTASNPPARASAIWIEEVSAANKVTLNEDEESTYRSGGGGGTDIHLGKIFPELREIDGNFFRQRRSNYTLETSGDTTNLNNGSWASETVVTGTDLLVRPDYRDDIVSLNKPNIRGIFCNSTTDGGGYGVLCWHVYGEISASETPDRLLYIDNATALEFKKPKDYGDVARGSAETYAMKLRNNSASLTASTVQLIAEALFQGSGAWYDFDEGSGFTATLSLASSIANGADSPVITVRRITPDAEALGLHEGRLQVSVGSWA